jgi:hypothetical protein
MKISSSLKNIEPWITNSKLKHWKNGIKLKLQIMETILKTKYPHHNKLSRYHTELASRLDILILSLELS